LDHAAGSVSSAVKSTFAAPSQEDMKKTVDAAKASAGEALRNGKHFADSAAHAAAHAADTTGKKVGEAASEAKKNAMQAAEKVLVKKPNTATTTVAPLVVPEPPATTTYKRFFGPGMEKLQASAYHWTAHVLLDVALVSLVFAAIELLCGIGKLAPRIRCGCVERGPMQQVLAATQLLKNVAVRWLWGAGLLAALWALSVVLAVELQPLAESIEHSPLVSGPSASAVPLALALVSLAFFGSHAWVLSEHTPCKCGTLKQMPLHIYAKKEEVDETKVSLLGGGGGDRARAVPESKSASILLERTSAAELLAACAVSLGSGGCTVMAAILGALLAAVEGPVFTCALGSAYRSLASTWWLLCLIPWEHVAPKVLGHKLSSPLPLFVAVLVPAALLGALLCWARRGAADAAAVAAAIEEEVVGEETRKAEAETAVAAAGVPVPPSPVQAAVGGLGGEQLDCEQQLPQSEGVEASHLVAAAPASSEKIVAAEAAVSHDQALE